MRAADDLRVALFVNGFPDAGRPHASVFNLRTAQELARHVDLTVLVPRAMKAGRPRLVKEEFEGVRVVRVAGPLIPGMERLSLRLFEAFLREPLRAVLGSSDVVHSVGVEFAGLLAGALGRRHGYCHVTQVINDLGCLKGRGFASYPYLAPLRKGLRGVLCNSRALEVTARRLFPQTALIRTAYRGTDLVRFTPNGAKASPLGEGGATRFLYLGGLPAYPDRIYGVNTKGGLTLMEAWRRGEEEVACSGATLFFGGPDSTGRLAQDWKASLRRPESVFLEGLVPPQDVPAHLRSADVVLIPSLEEGCPNLAFEALASGRAVVGSDIGPLQEILGDGECGLTVSAGEVDAWQETLLALSRADAVDRIRSMGRAARRTAEARFDNREYAKKLVGFYSEAIGSRE